MVVVTGEVLRYTISNKTSNGSTTIWLQPEVLNDWPLNHLQNQGFLFLN